MRVEQCHTQHLINNVDCWLLDAGPQVTLPTANGPSPMSEVRSPPVDRSTSKIPRPGLGWTSPHKQAPEAQPTAFASPSTSLPRQASMPKPVQAAPAQSQRMSRSGSLQRQPSGTARTRAMAAQLDARSSSGSLQQQPSQTSGMQASPIRPQRMTPGKGSQRQPSRTNGMRAMPAQPQPAQPAASASAPASAPVAAAAMSLAGTGAHPQQQPVDGAEVMKTAEVCPPSHHPGLKQQL